MTLYGVYAHAASSLDLEIADDKHHITADRTLYHSKEKVYEAFGHVVISSKGKRLSSDYAWIDTVKKELKARGNVIFVNTNSVIQASEIHYNLETSLGSIFYGSVSNDMYTLRGQLIRRISEDRFLTTEGEYTTCKDCTESWKLAAKNVDITFDGYAYMDNVYVKVKDTPTLYLPYLIVPVKTRRQTGLLFPKMSTGSRNGFAFVQPLFIDIDPHQDITLGLGKYSSRGARQEFEYRYKSYEGINGTLRFFRTGDRGFANQGLKSHRFALNSENEWPVWKYADIRWRVREVSDRKYPADFTEDVIGNNEAALESNFVWYAPFQDFYLSAEAKRYRNLIHDEVVDFDTGMVQSRPSVYFGVKERTALNLFSYNFSGRYDDYTRPNGAYYDVTNNRIFDPGVDSLRETKRFMFTPEVAMPFRVADIFSVSPSLQYHELDYLFPHVTTTTNPLSNTSQRYLLSRLELSTVFEKVFPYDGKEINKVKHQLSPFVGYSNILWSEKDGAHPFFSQLEKEGGLFDQFDIVPYTNSTNFLRLPLGNAVNYGFTSRLIRKHRAPDEVVRSYPFDILPKRVKKYPSPQNRKQEIQIEGDKLWDKYGPRYEDYEQVWDLTVSQTYDMREAKYQAATPLGDKKRAFSFLQAKSNMNIDNFSNTTEYKFFPRIVTKPTTTDLTTHVFSNKHAFSTSTTWYMDRLTNSRGTLIFQRSISLNFTNSSQPNPSRNISGILQWSFNDFFAVGYERNVDLIQKKKLTESFRTMYNSPSECWQVGFHFNQTNNNSKSSEFGVDLGVNLMGQGYVGINNISQGGSAQR